MAAGGEPVETQSVETRETEIEDSLENNSVLTVLLKSLYSTQLSRLQRWISGGKGIMGGQRRKFTHVRCLHQKVWPARPSTTCDS